VAGVGNLRVPQSLSAVTYTGTAPHRQIVSWHFGLLVPTDNDGWVALADANIAAAGSGWPVFKKFYGR
jgi:hypothetical protein